MAGRRVPANEDLSNVEFETSEDVEVLPTFNSMALREELLRGVYAYGECDFGETVIFALEKVSFLCIEMMRKEY